MHTIILQKLIVECGSKIDVAQQVDEIEIKLACLVSMLTMLVNPNRLWAVTDMVNN